MSEPRDVQGDTAASLEMGAHDLRRIRAELGISSPQLAAIAGVSETELEEMEAGSRPVPETLLSDLMEQLNAKGA